MSWMAQLLERGRQRHGDRVAVLDGERQVTYAELDRRTDSLATTFLAMGIERGHRVAVVSHNRLEVLETYFALGKIGAAAVPVHYGAVADEVAAVVKEYGVSAVVGEEGLPGTADHPFDCPVLLYGSSAYAEAVSCRPRLPAREVPDDELLFVLQTSATTGRPKGVRVDHRSLRSVTLGYLAEVMPETDIVFLHCGPLSHGAMVFPLMYMAAGATVALMRMFSPLECLATIRRAQVTHLFLVPDMLRFVLKAQGSSRTGLGRLREVIYGAAPMPRPLLLEARAAWGCAFRQAYGLTEAGGVVATLPPADQDYTTGEARGPAASVGRALLGTVIRSRDGELWVRGPGVMSGYWNDPGATEETLQDGWVRTGDLGTVDEQGYVHLTGRVKDVIVRGGQKIFPTEVEHVLLGHPAVREACVVGTPSEEWGELPFAYVVAADDDTAALDASLRELTRRHLARYKRPVHFEVVASLPRNAAGKVDRKNLRNRAAGSDRGNEHGER
ncbi:hypothetical protein AMK26_15870 [Streptomyces sp. CB03234]|uniref:class I adenylate-forming enzyme family protein n=1 Tax=Streptomyces sp. (strain CB03234) TaxID=1703937 RepID=UPI00093B851E|nr:AMP-binding protein [Streptomyces sp. CB03234]OKK04767.1 hypothetical protein AMK26_15870 [Streptomyces sp. CB03234]DAC74137.1 TPA_exp: AMP-dependent synthetase [Streptomyces sp. CB03234]